MNAASGVRAGRWDDLTRLRELAGEESQAPQWSESVWCALLQAGSGETGSGETGSAETVARCVTVAERGEAVLGFAVAQCALDVAELESVVVARTERRHGIGRRLCERAMRWAAERGAGEMHLEVRASNAAARALYAALGFVEVGERARYYRAPEEPAVLLTARLPGAVEGSQQVR